MRLSFRDKKAYIGQTPHVDNPSAYPAYPDAPNVGQPEKYDSRIEYVCPKCSSKLQIDGEDVLKCSNCDSRFSKRRYDSSYSHDSQTPGLLTMDSGNMSEYHNHESTSTGGTWTGNIGKN